MRTARNALPCILLLVVSLACTRAAHADPVTKRFYGYAYDLKSGAYLYTEVHKLNYDGMRLLGGLIRYFAPDNTLIGEKTLDFSADPYIPLTRFKLENTGYQERITAVTADSVSMERVEHGKLKTARVPRAPVMAADSGFHSFIVDHLDELAAGKTVPLTFGVAGKLTSFSFRVRAVAVTRFDGHEALRLRVEPDSMLRFLVDPLLLTYDARSHYLLQYQGVSNIINPATDKPYDVHIDYVQHAPADAPKNLPALE